MRFEKECSFCGTYDRGNPRQKPKVKNYHVENDEMVIVLFYPYCKHRVTIKRPYKRIDTTDGYVMVLTPHNYMLEHRFVWEQAHGKLERGIVVHHINGIKQDNRLENLIALSRHIHHSSMSPPEPISIICPHCQKEVELVKRHRNKYIVLGS